MPSRKEIAMLLWKAHSSDNVYWPWTYTDIDIGPWRVLTVLTQNIDIGPWRVLTVLTQNIDIGPWRVLTALTQDIGPWRVLTALTQNIDIGPLRVLTALTQNIDTGPWRVLTALTQNRLRASYWSVCHWPSLGTVKRSGPHYRQPVTRNARLAA